MRLSASCPAMSLGDRFYVSRRGRTGRGGWVYLHGEKSTTMSGLSNRESLISTGRIISVLFGIGKPRRPSDLVGPPFQAFKGHYPLHQVGISSLKVQ